MGRQILLIDDSAMLRRIAANVLHAQPARYEVVAATRASEGFARACSGDAAIILVDERIAHGADGDLCHRLLSEPRTANLPVVLLIGRHSDAPALDALPANVVETLSKPFAPEQLAGLVNTITALARKETTPGDMRLAIHPAAGPLAPAPRSDRPLPPEAPAHSHPSIRGAMQAVVDGAQTGILRFCPPDGLPTEVFFDRGSFVLVTTRDGLAYSRDATENLPAKVSPATLQEAAEEQSRTGIPFLLTLGARGLVSKGAAFHLLRRFGQRHFARLWMIPARCLRIDFEPQEALPGFTLRLEPVAQTVDEWLLGTLRLLTIADTAPEAHHQGMVGTPGFQRRGEAILKTLNLDEAERAFVRCVNGRNDLPTIARNLGLPPADAFLMVHRFRCLEVLDYRPAPLPFVLTPRTTKCRVLPLHR